jgi:hypothetical protein
MRWAGHVTSMGETRNALKIFVRKPDGKRSLGRSRRRWENNIRLDFKKWDMRVWTGLI